MKNKLPALILSTLLLVSSVLYACGGKTEETDTTVEDVSGITSAAETTESVDPRMLIEDGLPDKDYKEYEFKFLTNGDLVKEYAPEEEIGEVINDSVFRRNQVVNERFNVKIKTVDSGATDWSAHTQAVKKSIMAGDDMFDVALNHVIGGPNLSLENVFINLYDVPAFDFTKPWWHKQTNEELTLFGQMYLGSNTIFTKGVGSTKVVYVNKDKIREYGLEVPYADVFNGKWTLDKLISMSKDVYIDVNGDGLRDEGDNYGYVSHSLQNGFIVSTECAVLRKDDTDGLVIDVNNDRITTLVSKLYDWYFGSLGGFVLMAEKGVNGVERGKWQQTLFGNNQSLFAFGFIDDAVKFYRSSYVVYGILPQPKFDENQENYRAFSTDEFFAIPTTCTDLERTGIILEAMAAEGYKRIMPAYYEVALKQKYLHDDESVQILDLIVSSRTVSFAYVYDNWEGFGHMFSTIFTGNPSKDYASFYEKRLPSAEKRAAKIVAAFREMGEK